MDAHGNARGRACGHSRDERNQESGKNYPDVCRLPGRRPARRPFWWPLIECLSLRHTRTAWRERQPQRQIFDDETLVHDGFVCGYQFSLSGHFVYNCRHFCTISTHDNLINTAAFWRDTLRKHHCNVVGTLRYVYIYNGTYVLCV